MAIKMRVLYDSKKKGMAQFAKVIADKYELPINATSGKFPPEYPCDKERIVVLGLSAKGTVDYVIIGIGINCCQKEEDFAPDIRGIAASLSMVTEKEIDRARVAAAMMDSLYKMDAILLTGKSDILDRYRQNCITIGQEISLLRAGEEVRHGKAVDMDDEGALLVAFPDGHTETVNSGEVSVRGMYGYL